MPEEPVNVVEPVEDEADAPGEQKPRKRKQVAVDIAALQKIDAILDELENDQINRVLDFLVARHHVPGGQ